MHTLPIKSGISLIKIGFHHLKLVRTAIFFMLVSLRTLVVNLQYHRRKRAVHFTKMLVNRNAYLKGKLDENEKEDQN